MRFDAGVVVGGFDPWDMVERVVLRDRSADEAAVEDIRAADRATVHLRGRIRLAAAERFGGIEQVWIARNAVVAAGAAIRVGVDGDISRARIQTNRSFASAVD